MITIVEGNSKTADYTMFICICCANLYVTHQDMLKQKSKYIVSLKYDTEISFST